MEQQNYVISAPLAQEIVNYLSQRPYREVHVLIAAMQQLAPLEKEKDKP